MAPSGPAGSAWERRLRRLFWFIGAAGTFYYISSYALDRMREARLRAVRDRKQRDLIKSHFTSLLSTISFTLYALLPTLSPQVIEAFPVEEISLALQGLSTTGSHTGLDASVSLSGETSTNASASEGVNSSRASEVAETPEGSVVMSRGTTAEAETHAGGSDGPQTQGQAVQMPMAMAMSMDCSEPSTSQSWASEFERSSAASLQGPDQGYGQGGDGMGDSGVLSMGQAETDDGLASAISQTTSLPTDIDISNFSGSPPSDLSASIMHSPSPPRGPRTYGSGSSHGEPQPAASRSPTQSPSMPPQSLHVPPTVPPQSTTTANVNAYASKSKKELWRDLKIQSISRAVTTAVLIPLLHLMTVSQLSTLARRRYLEDVASGLPIPADPRTGALIHPSSLSDISASDAPPSASASKRQRDKGFKGGWFHSFSIEGMGLSEFVEESTSLLPSVSVPAAINPLAYLPPAVVSRLPVPSFLRSGQSKTAKTEAASAAEAREWEWEVEDERRMQREQETAEAERMYLTYSWWILHEGWKGVKERVDAEVERLFGTMPLKRELRAEDWEALVNEVINRILGTDNGPSEDAETLHIPTTLLPPSPLPALSNCPLPLTPSTSPALLALLHETRTHLSSPDAAYLVRRGAESMARRLIIQIKEEVYGIPEFTVLGVGMDPGNQEERKSKRLVDCLPALGKWGKDTWNEMPDAAVEGVIGGLEGEGMAGLIFGDWAAQGRE